MKLIRLIACSIASYRKYSLTRKKIKLEVKVNEITKKLQNIELALRNGYLSEHEFFEDIRNRYKRLEALDEIQKSGTNSEKIGLSIIENSLEFQRNFNNFNKLKEANNE